MGNRHTDSGYDGPFADGPGAFIWEDEAARHAVWRLVHAVQSSLQGTTGQPWAGTARALADQLVADGWNRAPIVETAGLDDEPEDRGVAAWSPYHVKSGCVMNVVDGLHLPGQGRDWKQCANCDEWPFEESRPTEGSTRAEINDFNRAYVKSLRRSAELIERAADRGDHS